MKKSSKSLAARETPQSTLATASRGTKDAALHAMADALVARSATILEANSSDVERAVAAGTAPSTVDRLRLDDGRIGEMAAGLREIAALGDPVGEVLRGSTLANGLELRQIRVPMGVVGIIYEARPNVTADAAGLCLKAGNAVLLRGSSSALASNEAIVAVLRDALAGSGMPADAVQLVPGAGHEPAKHLMQARGLVDVLIPRGGASLIASVVAESSVPVIETGVGNCHIYVDADADLDMALSVLLNAKVSRPSVCNAVETVLVHRDVADAFLPRALAALAEAGVTVHGDDAVRALGDAVPATAEDWDTEYHSLDLAAAVVPSPRRRRQPHPRPRNRSQRGDHHRLAARRAGVRRAGRCGRRARQRLHPVHRRRPVRLRCRDGHLHPEAARPRPDGPDRADVDQVRGHRRRARSHLRAPRRQRCRDLPDMPG